MIDLLDETQKPVTVFERYTLASQNCMKMEKEYLQLALEADEFYFPETAKYWKEYFMKQAARKRSDAEGWAQMAENWKDKK